MYVLGNVSNRARRGFNVSKMKVSGGWRIGIETRWRTGKEVGVRDGVEIVEPYEGLSIY